MSAAHTPGPWLVCEYGEYADCDGDCRVILGEGGDIRTAIVLGFNTKENQANAALIAAAPDLLADLMEAAATLRRYEKLHHSKGTADSLEKAEVNASLAVRFEATIAKATGEAA